MIVGEMRRLHRWSMVFAGAALAYVAATSENDAVASERITPVPAETTVVGLRQAGWVVTGQQKRSERRPGLPPYEMVDRFVHITTFVLEKAGQRKHCVLTYKSQLETITNECRDAE